MSTKQSKHPGIVTDTPCDGRCQWAMSDDTQCRCSCGGNNHGSALRLYFAGGRTPWYRALPIERIRAELDAADRQTLAQAIGGTYYRLRGYDAVGEAWEPSEPGEYRAAERGWITVQWTYPGGASTVAAVPLSRCVPINEQAYHEYRRRWITPVADGVQAGTS